MICPEGYEISAISGRCVQKCKKGFFRNPETGRCKRDRISTPAKRSPVARTSASRCPPGYEISAKSGKCILECKPGFERNPETGRCRRQAGGDVPRRSPVRRPPPARVSASRCPPGYEVSPKSGNCVLKCKPGFERSLETGRCKKNLILKERVIERSFPRPIARRSPTPRVSPVRMRTPSPRASPRKSPSPDHRCRPGSEINPKSGNCVLKCKPGFERSAETGRCRRAENIDRSPISESPGGCRCNYVMKTGRLCGKRAKRPFCRCPAHMDKMMKTPSPKKQRVYYPKTDTFAMDDPSRRVRYGGPKKYHRRTDIENMIALGKKNM